jgi:hypothetical protein
MFVPSTAPRCRGDVVAVPAQSARTSARAMCASRLGRHEVRSNGCALRIGGDYEGALMVGSPSCWPLQVALVMSRAGERAFQPGLLCQWPREIVPGLRVLVLTHVLS